MMATHIKNGREEPVDYHVRRWEWIIIMASVNGGAYIVGRLRFIYQYHTIK